MRQPPDSRGMLRAPVDLFRLDRCARPMHPGAEGPMPCKRLGVVMITFGRAIWPLSSTSWNQRENPEVLLPASTDAITDLGNPVEMVVVDVGSHDGASRAVPLHRLATRGFIQ